MNCHECQDWLQRRLDGDATLPDQALEQHWSQCAVCREQHQAALRLLEGLKQLPHPKPAPTLARELTTAVLRDRRLRLDKMRRRVYVTVALAASIMLLLLAGYLWLPRNPPDAPPTNEPMVKVPEKKVAPPIPKENVEPKKSEPRHALTALTDRWAGATRDHATVVLAAANLDAVEKLPMNDLPALDPGVREASQEVTDGVRAVTRNTRRAFDFLARELPMPEFGPVE